MKSKNNTVQNLFESYYKCPYDFPIDIEKKEVDKFGYFEAILGRDGVVYDAPNGHTQGLRSIIAREKNIPVNEVDNIANKLWYMEWLIKESGAVLLWHNFAMGNPNDVQKKTLSRLIEIGHMDKNAGVRTMREPIESEELK